VDYIDSVANSGQANVVVSDGGNFSVGEQVVLYDGQNAFETVIILSISTDTLTMTTNLANTYSEGSRIGRYLGYLDTTNNKFQRLLAPDLGTGADGAFVSSGNATWNSEKNYTSITIQSGHIITIDGNFAIKCQGLFDIQAGGKLTAKGYGHAGGAGGQYTNSRQGTSQLGVGTTSQTANGGGGGGGDGSGSSTSRGGGGGAGYGNAGTDGNKSAGETTAVGGSTYNDAGLTTFSIEYLKGSGGGGGGSSETGCGNGGEGGGIIRIHCLNFICAGEIDCDGNDGVTPSLASAYYKAAGGGGSGGTIFIQVIQKAIVGTALIHASGGAGGLGKGTAGNDSSGNGGAGGAGRIRIEAGKITGTTSPTHATGYSNNMGAFAKYGFYHTEEIQSLNDLITGNCYIEQEIVRTANIASSASAGQADVIVDDASVYNEGEKIILIENEKMEVKTIDSIVSNTLTMTENLINSYTTSGDVYGIDAYADVSIEPVGDDENFQAMTLQTVDDLGDSIYLITYSKTVRNEDVGEAGVRFVGRVRLQGNDNDTTDINVKNINWAFI